MIDQHIINRREAVAALAASALAQPPDLRKANRLFRPWMLTSFSADVTPPIGHPCMGGGIAPARNIVDRLEAIGFVLWGATLARPVVFVALDWCELRNDAYDRWREVLARTARTDIEHVLVTTVHQHDAPIADLRTQRMLEDNHCGGLICNRAFHELMVQRVARAMRLSLAKPVRVTHLGIGQAKVEKVASNRRYALADGTIVYDRTSASRSPRAHEAPEETIDPWLKTLSFWNNDVPVLALSHYAVHPMSYYGQGGVSADFVGLARRARQKALPNVVQLYVSGCSGNVTAGKYNDGSAKNRPVLASRMETAMAQAWAATRCFPFERANSRVAPLRFEPRNDTGFSKEELKTRLTGDPKPFGQCLAALGLSWRDRVDSGQTVDLPVLDLGPAVLALLPGESYVEYQLLAQKLRPDAFVMAVGYGEAGTGYIPTHLQVAEHDANLRDWCWIAPSAEQILSDTLQRALKAPS
ncbi:MAG: hypothetical protein ACP5XB_21965 [Isosphaeraceae bacterium]